MFKVNDTQGAASVKKRRSSLLMMGMVMVHSSGLFYGDIVGVDGKRASEGQDPFLAPSADVQYTYL